MKKNTRFNILLALTYSVTLIGGMYLGYKFLKDQGFNEGKSKPFTPADIRFTTKGNAIYAVVMAWPENGIVQIKSMKQGSSYLEKSVSSVTLLGTGQKLSFKQHESFLEVDIKDYKPKLSYTFALKIA